MTVQSLFAKGKWTKNTMDRGRGRTKKYCLVGAIYHVYYKGGGVDKALRRTERAIRELFPSLTFAGITFFNDRRDVTLEDVKKVARRARI